MGGKRAGSGRQSIHIDLAEVEKLCALQCTDEEIAAFFSVSVSTIERRKQRTEFREAMERGKARGRVSLRRRLFEQATKSNNIAATIFLAKNLLGYRDVMANEHSGPGGGPIKVSGRPDLSKLSNEDLKTLRDILAKTERPG